MAAGAPEDLASNSSGDEPATPSEIRTAALKIWKHQNQLMWGRAQTAYAAEAAILAGAYTLTKDTHSVAAKILLACGAIVLCLIFVLIVRDNQVRERCSGIASMLIPLEPPILGVIRGVYILLLITFLLIIANVILAIMV